MLKTASPGTRASEATWNSFAGDTGQSAKVTALIRPLRVRDEYGHSSATRQFHSSWEAPANFRVIRPESRME
jgi:hypothetical protein